MNPSASMSSDSSPVPPPPNSWASLSPSMATSSAGYQISPSNGPPPQTVYSSSPVTPSVSIGLPFYPMMLPGKLMLATSILY